MKPEQYGARSPCHTPLLCADWMPSSIVSASSSFSLGRLDPQAIESLEGAWRQLCKELHSPNALEEALQNPRRAWNPYRTAPSSPTLKDEIRRSQLVEFQGWKPLQDELVLHGHGVVAPQQCGTAMTTGEWDRTDTEDESSSVFPALPEGRMLSPEDLRALQVVGGRLRPEYLAGEPFGTEEIFAAHGTPLSETLVSSWTTRKGGNTTSTAQAEEVEPVVADVVVEELFTAIWKDVVVPFYQHKTEEHGDKLEEKERRPETVNAATLSDLPPPRKTPRPRTDSTGSAPVSVSTAPAGAQNVDLHNASLRDSSKNLKGDSRWNPQKTALPILSPWSPSERSPQQLKYTHLRVGNDSFLTCTPKNRLFSCGPSFLDGTLTGGGQSVVSLGNATLSTISSLSGRGVPKEKRYLAKMASSAFHCSPRTSPREQNILEILAQPQGFSTTLPDLTARSPAVVPNEKHHTGTGSRGDGEPQRSTHSCSSRLGSQLYPLHPKSVSQCLHMPTRQLAPVSTSLVVEADGTLSGESVLGPGNPFLAHLLPHFTPPVPLLEREKGPQLRKKTKPRTHVVIPFDSASGITPTLYSSNIPRSSTNGTCFAFALLRSPAAEEQTVLLPSTRDSPGQRQKDFPIPSTLLLPSPPQLLETASGEGAKAPTRIYSPPFVNARRGTLIMPGLANTLPSPPLSTTPRPMRGDFLDEALPMGEWVDELKMKRTSSKKKRQK